MNGKAFIALQLFKGTIFFLNLALLKMKQIQI